MQRLVFARQLMRLVIKLNILAMAGVLLLVCSYAYAETNCSSAQTDAEMNRCWDKEKSSAENELNAEYASAKQRIAKAYTTHKELLAQYNAILLDSQRGWLKYRDNQCRLEAFMADEKSAVYAALIDQCTTRIDRERVAQLKSIPYE